MSTSQMPALAVLGAGHVGPVIARLAVKAGCQVAVATSGDPDDIALITELIIPGAHSRWAADAVAGAGIVVLAIPLHRFPDLDPSLLAGKLVVDAMNYWPASDGELKACAKTQGVSHDLHLWSRHFRRQERRRPGQIAVTRADDPQRCR